MTWAVHVSIAPTWFDPAETPGIITPLCFCMPCMMPCVKPMPDNQMSPSLATKWSESADGLTYDFELRHGVKFHNGDPFTAEDVKFSFERYKGTGARELKKKVKAIEIVNPHHIRYTLHEPWPDFLTFYATPATGAGWIVPKNYTEKIGNDEFKNKPVGLGPYRFVSYQSGIELVLEANADYWRKVPSCQASGVQECAGGNDASGHAQKPGSRHDLWPVQVRSAEEVRRDKSLKLEPVMISRQRVVVYFADHVRPQIPMA